MITPQQLVEKYPYIVTFDVRNIMCKIGDKIEMDEKRLKELEEGFFKNLIQLIEANQLTEISI